MKHSHTFTNRYNIVLNKNISWQLIFKLVKVLSIDTWKVSRVKALLWWTKSSEVDPMLVEVAQFPHVYKCLMGIRTVARRTLPGHIPDKQFPDGQKPDRHLPSRTVEPTDPVLAWPDNSPTRLTGSSREYTIMFHMVLFYKLCKAFLQDKSF